MMNKKVGDSGFTGMPEWWISKVVCQCSGSYDGAKIKQGAAVCERWMPLQDDFAYALAQRPAHTRNLQTMRKPCVHEIMFRQWMNLRLILEAPKRL
jgi:hypothetical protein